METKETKEIGKTEATICILGTGMLSGYLEKVCKMRGLKYKVLGRKEIDARYINVMGLVDMLKNTLSDPDNFNTIVNCIGTSPDSTVIDQLYVNSIFPHRLQIAADVLGIRMVHISSDVVYAEKKNTYALSKYLGETRNCIRTSIIGETGGLMKWFIDGSKSDGGNSESKNVYGYTNQIWRGITCLELSRHILDGKYGDLFSKTEISKYNLLILIKEIYRLDIEIVPEEIKNPTVMIYPSDVHVVEKDIRAQLVELMRLNEKDL